MSRVKAWITKWKTDYDFKTVVSAAGSFVVTMAFALYNGFLGAYFSRLFLFLNCSSLSPLFNGI